MTKRTYDHSMLLKDAGAVVADGAATVGGSAKVVDLGAGGASGPLVAVVDVSAIDFANATETYSVRLQGATDEAMTTPVELAARAIMGTGRTEIPFTNEVAAGGTFYRYLRAYIDVGGDTPSINCTIFVAKQ